MAKFLLFVVVLVVIYALVRASGRRKSPPPPPAAPPDQAMARCAHCGVHFPRAEAVADGGDDYCCEEHRRLGVGS